MIYERFPDLFAGVSWEKTARETLAVYRSLLQEGVR